MYLSFRSISGVLLSLTTAAAPAALASSSAGSAQTPSPPAEAPLQAATVQTPEVQTATVQAAEAQPDIAEPVAPPQAATPSINPSHVACVAKVIIHEAAHEPRQGRIAVAQVIRARIRDGRFAGDACAVTRQRGQFFNVDAFDPPRGPTWDDAVAIATDTLSGDGDDLVPGALYFHASYSPMPGHARVGQIGGHVFYR